MTTGPLTAYDAYTGRPSLREGNPAMQQKFILKSLFFAPALAVALAAGLSPFAHALDACNPRAYGAKGNGIAKDTVAIQKAINVCERQGGGTVELTAGTYLSGPIVLKSNITLQLDKGATLLGSSDHADYPAITEFRAPGRQALVSAVNSANVAITGEGIIDGNGASWWKMARTIRNAGVMGNPHTRPRLVVFDHCHHVRVQGVTIENSPMWQLVPYYSDDVVIRNVRILAPARSPNTDAIDPFSSSHVVIDHVYADVGDDDVAIKSGAADTTANQPSRAITITDCTFLHGHGLSIGSEIAGGAQNITAENIRFHGTDNGIRVKAYRDRGHDVSHLLFRDIEMTNVRNALIVSEYYPRVLPPAGEAPQPVTQLTPHFNGITFENVTASGSRTAGVIAGLPEAPIANLVLRNVKISAQTGLTVAYASVSGRNVVIRASRGAPVVELTGAQISLH